MDDIREQFHAFDRLEVPDQWHEIERRPLGSTIGRPPQFPSVSRRLLVAAVAIAIATASFLLLTDAFRHGKSTPAVTPPPVSPITGLPAGTIAFAGGHGSLPRILTISSDGNHEVALSPPSLLGPASPYPAQQPAWSPDGRLIAFSGTWGGAGELKRDLYVMNADGSGLRRITYGLSAGSPSWSPSGAYVVLVAQQGELYRINVDTGHPQGITPSTVQAPSWPAYSPDGSTVAFSARALDGHDQIFLIRSDGSGRGLTQLTTASEDAQAPAWSPDGTQIAYEGQSKVQSNLYIMNSDGSRQRLLAGCGASACYFTHPSWSSDGQWIIYNCNQSLCAVRPDGTDMHVALHVQPGTIGFTDPAWQPSRNPVTPQITITPTPDGASPSPASAATAAGWSLSYPGQWRAQLQPNTCQGATHQETRAIIVANTDFVFRPYSPVGCTVRSFGRWVLAGFPSNGVALALEPEMPFPLGGKEPVLKKLPVSLSDLRPTGGIIGGPKESYGLLLGDHLPRFEIRVWIGPDATPADISQLGLVLHSVELSRSP